MPVSKNVTRWAETIEQAVADIGAVRLDLGTMLALVATESSGKDTVINRFGFVGLLQVGTPYLKDARRWIKRHRPGLLKEIPRTKYGLNGNARASVLVTAAYMRKYSEFHDWDPRRIAGIHKGGAGSAARLDRMLQEGWALRNAVRWIADNWRYSKGRRKGKLILGRSFYDYIFGSRHFAGHKADYDAWVPEPAPEPTPTPKQAWTRFLRSVWADLTKGGDA